MIQNVGLTKEKLSPQPSTCLGIYLCPHDVSAFELPQTLKTVSRRKVRNCLGPVYLS